LGCTEIPLLIKKEDLDSIFYIINDAAKAYKGIIPPDRNYVIHLSSDYDVMLWYVETDRRIKLENAVHAKWF
jgi:hypothetical protein